jgi:hypothetical protein
MARVEGRCEEDKKKKEAEELSDVMAVGLIVDEANSPSSS